MAIFTQTVIRLRATRLTDDGGTDTPQRDWAGAASATIAGVSVQPVTTSEQRDGAGIAVTAQWRLYSRRGTDIDVTVGDRVVWDGKTLDVVGEPQRWQALGSVGWHHGEFLLRELPLTLTGASGVEAVLRDQMGMAADQQQPWTP